MRKYFLFLSEKIEKRRKGGFVEAMFGKSEKKRGSLSPLLMVGALAVVGAASITKKGKALIKGFVSKCKNMVCKKDCAQ